MGRSSSWGSIALGFNADQPQQVGRSSSGYLSTFLTSVKLKAAALRWPQHDTPLGNPEGNKTLSSLASPPLRSRASKAVPARETEADELPLSSEILDEQVDLSAAIAESTPAHDLSSTSDNYDKFKSDQETRLEEWLEETKGHTGSTEAK